MLIYVAIVCYCCYCYLPLLLLALLALPIALLSFVPTSRVTPMPLYRVLHVVRFFRINCAVRYNDVILMALSSAKFMRNVPFELTCFGNTLQLPFVYWERPLICFENVWKMFGKCHAEIENKMPPKSRRP